MKNYLNMSLIVAVVATISYLSTASISAPSGLAPLGHFLMYFSLAASFLLYFHDKKHDHVDAVILAAVTGLMFEFFQSQIPYRTFSVFDAAVNTAGAGVILTEKKVPVIHRVVDLEERLIDKVLG